MLSHRDLSLFDFFERTLTPSVTLETTRLISTTKCWGWLARKRGRTHTQQLGMTCTQREEDTHPTTHKKAQYCWLLRLPSLHPWWAIMKFFFWFVSLFDMPCSLFPCCRETDPVKVVLVAPFDAFSAVGWTVWRGGIVVPRKNSLRWGVPFGSYRAP